MFNILLFAGISLGLVCLVVMDCRARLHTPGAEDSPQDRVPRD